MEANNELTRAQLLASPPMRLEDVDAWLAKYNAVIDAARAETLRVERLRDAAPDLVKALEQIARLSSEGEVSANMQYALGDIARAAIAKAGAA